AGQPWKGAMSTPYGAVPREEEGEGYRMWYDAYWDGECHNRYATSKDGIHWTTPELGLVSYRGSKDNNILFRRTRQDHLPQVIYTPWASNPERRYKLMNYASGRTPPAHLISGFPGS